MSIHLHVSFVIDLNEMMFSRIVFFLIFFVVFTFNHYFVVFLIIFFKLINDRT